MPATLQPQSPYVFYASRMGVPAIANVASPQSGPDGTTVLQAILNLNSPSGPYAGLAIEVVIDIPILCGGILLYSNTTLRGMGAFDGPTPPSGLWLHAITNSVLNGAIGDSGIIRNANWRSPYLAATIVDSNITVRDLYLDGQRRNSVSGSSSPKVNSYGMLIMPIQFFGVNNLHQYNLSIYDPCSFHCMWANINGGVSDGLKFWDPTYYASQPHPQNTDGHKLVGPANNITFRNYRGCTGDDFTSISLADGNLNGAAGIIAGTTSAEEFGGYTSVYGGSITDVLFEGFQPQQSSSLCSMYLGNDPAASGTTFYLKNVTIRDMIGSVNGIAVFEVISGNGTGFVASQVLLENFQLRPNGATRGGGINVQNGPFLDLTLKDFTCNDLETDTGSGMLPVITVAGTVTKLTIDALFVVEDSSEVSAPDSLVQIKTGASIDEMNLVNCGWNRRSSTAVAFCTISGGSVNRVELTDCQFNNIYNALAITGGTVGAVNVVGLSHRSAGGNPSISIGTGVTLATLNNIVPDTASFYGGSGTVTTYNAYATSAGSGVTSITAGTGLTGGTITTTGTIALANPSATTLGGIESYAAVAHQWINGISTSGVPSSTQPAFTDISGAITAAQLPGLAATDIWVGNGSGVATAVAISGDGTLSNAGALTVASIGGEAVSLAGTFTTSGAHPLTLTTTGTTNVTLPTSGTLSTTTGTVTSIVAGTGLTGGTITTTGTVALSIPVAASSGGTGVANSSTITIGGNITFSGAYTFAATLTAATVVTFPTSGTLAILGANTFTAEQTINPSSGPSVYLEAGSLETAIYANGNSGTSKAIAWDNGNNQSVTITGAVTFTFTAPTNPGKFTIICKQDGSGHVYAFPSSVLWPGGTVPTLSSTANAIDIVSFLYDGTSYYGVANTAFAT
jgi:hypothetical protein